MMDASVEIPEKYGFAVDEDSYKKCVFCSRSIDGKSTRCLDKSFGISAKAAFDSTQEENPTLSAIFYITRMFTAL
jgi:hypothetical protein